MHFMSYIDSKSLFYVFLEKFFFLVKLTIHSVRPKFKTELFYSQINNNFYYHNNFINFHKYVIIFTKHIEILDSQNFFM